MVLRCFRNETVFAGLATKTQAQVVVADKAEFSTTIRTAVLRLAHDNSPPVFGGRLRQSMMAPVIPALASTAGVVCLPAAADLPKTDIRRYALRRGFGA